TGRGEPARPAMRRRPAEPVGEPPAKPPRGQQGTAGTPPAEPDHVAEADRASRDAHRSRTGRGEPARPAMRRRPAEPVGGPAARPGQVPEADPTRPETRSGRTRHEEPAQPDHAVETSGTHGANPPRGRVPRGDRASRDTRRSRTSRGEP